MPGPPLARLAAQGGRETSQVSGSSRARRQLLFSSSVELDHAPFFARAELDRSKRSGYYVEDFFRYFLRLESGVRSSTVGDR